MAARRFVYFTTFYPPFNFGGDGIDVQRTARALVRRGHQVTVVHDTNAYEWLSGRRVDDQPVDQDGVEVIGLRSRLGMVSPLLTQQLGRPFVHGRAIDGIIRERTPDVVVFGNASLVGGPDLLSVGGSALRVYVAHEHWLVCPTHVLWKFNREPCEARSCTRCVLSYRRPPQFWRYTGKLERRVGNVDVFIARSEFSRQKHREFGFAPPMQVLPYFLPGDLPDRPEATSSARPHERPYFLTVGRLTKIKGLDSLIRAFRNYPDADLLIVGHGEELGALKAQARGLSNVKFVGAVPNHDLRRFYEHAIAAVMPSRGYETFGIVLIEAFRYGTPVIARRIGPFPEIIEEAQAGFLFGDEPELIAAMTRLQGDPALRHTLAASGYRACRERWSEHVVIPKFLEIIDGAFASRAPRAAGAR